MDVFIGKLKKKKFYLNIWSFRYFLSKQLQIRNFRKNNRNLKLSKINTQLITIQKKINILNSLLPSLLYTLKEYQNSNQAENNYFSIVLNNRPIVFSLKSQPIILIKFYMFYSYKTYKSVYSFCNSRKISLTTTNRTKIGNIYKILEVGPNQRKFLL